MITIHVPGPPVAKARARHGRTRAGKPITYTDAKTKNYEALVAVSAAQAMAGRPPLDSALQCELMFWLAPPRSWSKKKTAAALAGEVLPTSRPDIDNFIKSVCDACNGVVWTDDSRVWSLLAQKRYAAEPYVEVRVWEVNAH